MHDMVIRGGTIVDGTGAARFTGDIAIDNGLISQVGKVSGSGKEEIDATGMIVAPGWSMCTPIMMARPPGIRKWRLQAGMA